MAGRRWIPRRCAETSAASVCTNAAAAADGPGNVFVGLAPGYRPGDGAQAGDAPSVPRRRPGGGRRVRVRRPAHPTSPRYPASRPGPGAASPHRFRGDPSASCRDVRQRHQGQARLPARIRRRAGRHNGYSGGHAGYPGGSVSPVRSAGGKPLNALGSRGIDADRQRPHIGRKSKPAERMSCTSIPIGFLLASEKSCGQSLLFSYRRSQRTGRGGVDF